jgi:DNA-binding transcriptional MerR regulator
MEGGFRLYSPEDMERIDRIRQLKELLGFSLAEIKEMLEAEDVRLQIKAGWRKDADAEEKAEKARLGREVTIQQITLIDQKMEKMASLREQLAERVAKYDELLQRFADATDTEPAPARS